LSHVARDVSATLYSRDRGRDMCWDDSHMRRVPYVGPTDARSL